MSDTPVMLPTTTHAIAFGKLWWRVALLQLVIFAFIGLLLRYLMVDALPGLNFKNILHAHSHGALLGWLYSAFFVGLVLAYLPQHVRSKAVYAWLFWLSQVAVLGMLLSFPVQGYAGVSITFSTLHILLSYGFAWRFWRDLRKLQDLKQKCKASLPFIRLSLLLMVLSSLGPWSLGPIMASGNSGSELYYNAIYFYLHFQYNGWFTFAALGLFFYWLEQNGLAFSGKNASLFFRLMAVAVVPAYLLSVLWTGPDLWVYIVGGLSALLQIIALAVFLKILWQIRAFLHEKLARPVKLLFCLALAAFAIKLGLQLVSAFPAVAMLAYKVRHFVIGYLHLALIGFVSLFVLGFFAQTGWLAFRNRIAQTGLGCFLAGFFLSELLIFAQGTAFWLRLGAIPEFNFVLFLVSVLMPVGLLLLVIGQKRGKAVKGRAVKRRKEAESPVVTEATALGI